MLELLIYFIDIFGDRILLKSISGNFLIYKIIC
jgi:hypothetical protein